MDGNGDAGHYGEEGRRNGGNDCQVSGFVTVVAEIGWCVGELMLDWGLKGILKEYDMRREKINGIGLVNS